MFLAGELMALGVSQDLASRICSFLEISAGDLAESKPPEVGRAAFGAAPASQSCSVHADKARQVVHDAITDMVAGLRGYRDSIELMRRETTQVDETTEADMVSLVQRSESCIAPTFSSPSQCTVPSGEGSDS